MNVAEMLVQTNAVHDMTMQLQAIQRANKEGKATEQPSPFETPRAERPQDLAYKHFFTTSKKKTQVKETTSTPAVPTTETETDRTITELVK